MNKKKIVLVAILLSSLFLGSGLGSGGQDSPEKYRKAAEQGDAAAQNSLANCYFGGIGVAKDYAEAVKWYRKAAERGYPSAQNSLGVCYEKGLGVARDSAEAMKWFQKAAAQGNALAINNVLLLAERSLFGSSAAKPEPKAAKPEPKAAVPAPGRAQGGFTRDGNEALALRLAKAYQDSLTRTAGWEQARKEMYDLMANPATRAASAEDQELANRAVEAIGREQTWRQGLLESWGANRAVQPAPAWSFASRYGPLSNVQRRSVDPKYDAVEYAIRNVPSNPAAALPPTPLRCAQESMMFTNGNVGGVQNGPTQPTRFQLREPALVTYLMSYHWNNGAGQPPGTVVLRHQDGTAYGGQATSAPGQVGASNVYWIVRPNVVLKPGIYTVVDSHPSTWAQNAQSQGQGMVEVKGCAAREP